MTDDPIAWLREQIQIDASGVEAAIEGTLRELAADNCPTTTARSSGRSMVPFTGGSLVGVARVGG